MIVILNSRTILKTPPILNLRVRVRVRFKIRVWSKNRVRFESGFELRIVLGLEWYFVLKCGSFY